MTADRADALVSQKSFWWKLVHSTWILVVIAGFGLISPAAWCWAGATVGSRRFWHVVEFWFILSVGTWVFILSGGVDYFGPAVEDVVMSLLLFCWLGGSVHAIALRRTVLRAVAEFEEDLAQLGAQVEAERARWNASSGVADRVSHHLDGEHPGGAAGSQSVWLSSWGRGRPRP